MAYNKNDGPDSRDVRTIEKLERDWENKKEKAEQAQKNLEEEFRKFFREKRAVLAKEAIENINKAPGSNPFNRYKGSGEGVYGGEMTGRDRLGEDE